MAVSITEPPPTATIPSTAADSGELNGVEERHVGGFDAHLVVQHRLYAGSFERAEHRLDGRQPRQVGVGDDQRLPDAQIDEVHPDLPRDAGAKAHVGGGHFKRVLLLH